MTKRRTFRDAVVVISDAARLRDASTRQAPWAADASAVALPVRLAASGVPMPDVAPAMRSI